MTGFLKSAFLRSGDTDTLASMVGSILGALHGGDWLGDLGRRVQDRDYIEGSGSVHGPFETSQAAQPDLFSTRDDVSKTKPAAESQVPPAEDEG